MLLLSRLLLVALYTSSVLANSRETTWGSFVITYHGEKTPSLASGNHHFTPRGAIQAQNSGQIVRERYIAMRTPTNSPPNFYPIDGIALNDILNSQLSILTLDDEIMTGSALAFMQGLYPPKNSSVNSEEFIWTPGWNGSGSLDSYPIGGYQYPLVKTVNTVTDFDSIWVSGHTSCDKYSTSQVEYRNTSAYTNRVQSSYKFYQELRKTIFERVQSIDAGQVDFRKAKELYEYALYEKLHNSTIAKFSKFTQADLGQLSALAYEQQFGLNSGNISSIAGKTLAGKVLTQMNQLMLNSAGTTKLSLMFTSFEPFLSFFDLSKLSSSGPSAPKFRSLPNHGSMMAFELFSSTDPLSKNNVAKTFPSQADLYVRFLFRNGSEDALTAYPLFGHGPSRTEMSWYEFSRAMQEFAVLDVDQWCTACATDNTFCKQLSTKPSVTNPSDNQNHGLSPAVSGVIGALVALAIAALAFVALALLGFRLQCNSDPKSKAGKSDLGVLRTSSGNGGYKGAEKLASDTDLRLKSGAGATVVRHERVGSWELKDGPRSPPPVYPSLDDSLDKDLESGRVRSHVDYSRRSEEYEDLGRVNPFGDPVKHADQI